VFSHIGYSPEIPLIETGEVRGAKVRDSDVEPVNQWLRSMITSANLTTIGSFGIAFYLAGILLIKSEAG